MPSAYAHYQFGAQLLTALPADICGCVQRHRKLYDLGLQGPDFFFYYKLGKDTPVKHLAWEYHHRTGVEVFSKICRDLPDPTGEEQAYLYGLLGHYCLDAACHPVVSQVTGENALAHNTMESEFERFLLARDGVAKPHFHNRCREIRCSDKDALVIGRFYPEAKPDEIKVALNTMGVVLGLLTIHPGAKIVLDLMGDPNPGLLMHTKPNPAYVKHNQNLLEAYDRALIQYPELLEQLHGHITQGKNLGKAFEPIFG